MCVTYLEAGISGCRAHGGQKQDAQLCNNHQEAGKGRQACRSVDSVECAQQMDITWKRRPACSPLSKGEDRSRVFGLKYIQMDLGTSQAST